MMVILGSVMLLAIQSRTMTNEPIWLCITSYGIFLVYSICSVVNKRNGIFLNMLYRAEKGIKFKQKQKNIVQRK